MIVLALCFVTQLSSAGIQQKFNEFVNKLLGGYTQFLFFGQKKPTADMSQYIVFDLNIKNTIDKLTFVINERNMQYIISKNDIQQINQLKEFCTKKNKEIKELKEKLATMQWLKFIRPYGKTDSSKNINELKSATMKSLESMIHTINKDRKTTIKLIINQSNDQYSISWDPDTNDLLYLKILATTAIYTLFEGLKPLLKNKKLNAIHKKWHTIEEIANIDLHEEHTEKALEKISEKFAETMKKNLSTAKQYLDAAKDYFSRVLITLVPYAILGTAQVTAYGALISILKKTMPPWIYEYIDKVFEQEVALFQPSEERSEFLTFIDANDEIEKELIDIFSFKLSENARTIISSDIQDSITGFNQNIEGYLENCLLEYSKTKSVSIKKFNRNKKPLVDSLHEQFKSIKRMLSVYPNIILKKKDSELVIEKTNIYEIQAQIVKILQSLDQKTQKEFNDKIEKIFANSQTTSEQKLASLEVIQVHVKKIAKDTKEKNALINELHYLISQLKLSEDKKKGFTSNVEIATTLSGLLQLKTYIQDILSKQPKSRTEQLKAGVGKFLGLATNTEKVNLEKFISEKYEAIGKQYENLPSNQKSPSLEKRIVATKKRFLKEADEITYKHALEPLKETVEQKVQQFEAEIKTTKERLTQ